MPSKEEISARDTLEKLGFVSSVDPKIMEDFQYTEASVEWLTIDVYSMRDQILERINKAGKISTTSSEFISEASRMKEVDSVLICLISIEGRDRHIGFMIDIQRELCSIFSGDGFAPCCRFAVKPIPPV